jgi:hypothetical protein
MLLYCVRDFVAGELGLCLDLRTEIREIGERVPVICCALSSVHRDYISLSRTGNRC